uniref:HECT-type E3 ubiquitin transferase n=1 Tax=Meleagris gallopavo TaxID=9103 RepID=A0A803YIZ6_MELGA
YYKQSHQTIMNFWTVFHKLPEEKKKKFLDPLCENPDNSYPSARTCNYTLFLPKYSSKEILEEKLLFAIEYNEGFGLS